MRVQATCSIEHESTKILSQLCIPSPRHLGSAEGLESLFRLPLQSLTSRWQKMTGLQVCILAESVQVQSFSGGHLNFQSVSLQIRTVFLILQEHAVLQFIVCLHATCPSHNSFGGARKTAGLRGLLWNREPRLTQPLQLLGSRGTPVLCFSNSGH